MSRPVFLAAPPLANSYWVLQPGLLAGEHPSGDSDADTRGRIQALLESGVNAFLDLTKPGECTPYLGHLPPDVEYDNRPLIDHGLPEVPEQMQDILGVVGDALRRGRTIYVHCRAGIGRTGMVVGCMLASRGRNGEQALEELNRLWQQCQRSYKWLLVPETPQQRDYVLNWKANEPTTASAAHAAIAGAPTESQLLSDPAALAAVSGLRDRFHGALLGLAVGDALAVSTQLRAAGSFTPVADLLGGGVFDLPRGAWTDETAMALCLADSLLACNGFDARDQVRRYVRWQTEGYLSATGQCVGITAGVTRALGAARFRRQPFAGSHDPQQLDKDPLTRVAPAVMFHFASAQDAVAQATEAARTTCQAPAVLAATGYFAACLHAALSAAPRAQLTAPLQALWTPKAPPPRLADLAAGNFGARPALAEGAARDAIDVLQAALAAFADTGNFRDGALAAVNLGGDSDAIGAIYGQLAGAYYGVQGIPAAWKAALLRRDLLEDYADRLLAQAMVALAT
jgi:ADP-ribosylglycohydrolase